MCKFASTLIFCVVYSVIAITLSFGADVFPLSSSKSSPDRQDAAGVETNMLDIHLAMEPGSTLLNLKSVVLGGNDSFLRGYVNAASDNKQAKSPLVVRSTTGDKETRQVACILTLDRTDNTPHGQCIDPESMCPKQKSMGVQYNSCKKIQNNQSRYPRNCKEIQQNGYNVSGIYDIFPRYSTVPIAVLCDMETKGGGWTHIQKRFDGSLDFVQEWKDYKFGFGNLEGEFWLGLHNIYLLSAFELTELLVEVVDRDNVSAYAQYSSFAIGSESQGYTLERLSGFSGDAGDSLTYHLGQKFCTKDLDFSAKNCATIYNGGWWYKDCHISNLNGKFSNIDLPDKYKFKGIHWKTFRSHEYCHSKSRMLVRPVN